MRSGLSASDAIDDALEGALQFLRGNQLADGEFATLASPDPTLATGAVYDSSPFATAHILYSLGFAPGAASAAMADKAAAFLDSQMERPGLWRYWTRKNPRHAFIPPDVDDVCCTSAALRSHGARAPAANVELLLTARNEDGSFFTWLFPRTAEHEQVWQRLQANVDRRAIAFVAIARSAHDRDCVATANALWYLGNHPELAASARYVCGVAAEQIDRPPTSFYPDAICFCYAVSRAWFCGARSLEPARLPIVDAVRRRFPAGAPVGESLHLALAMCTLINFGYTGVEVDRGVEALVVTQHQDGGWPCLPWFLGPAPYRPGIPAAEARRQLGYYGSREITTAFCVEALARHRG